MKQLVTLYILILSSFSLISAQKVDSIRTEQSGDFIKIRYRILDSKPGELYRVKVLASINGGLKTELENVSGDTGDQVPGGKNEYWVIWDVLKDVDEVKSAEFIVRAELVNIPVTQTQGTAKKLNTSGWDKKGFNLMIASMLPGPKLGIRAGYMRNFGVLITVAHGKSLISPVNYPNITETFDPPENSVIGLALSKRIVNKNRFQMHATAGIIGTHTTYYNTKAPDHAFGMQEVKGLELGLAFGIKRLALSLSAVNFDPKQNEKGSALVVASPRTYISGCIGLRF